MARKYQGHARRTGFQRRDPGYQSLNRMQQQGDRVIRGLEEDRQEQLRVEQNYARSLDNNFERSQQNRQELFNLQSRIDDNRMQAERNLALQRIRDAKTEQGNVETANRQLAQFSQTLFNSIEDSYNTVQDIEKKSGFVSAMINDLKRFKPSQEYLDNQEVLNKQSDAYEEVSQTLNVSQGAVQQFRADNPARRQYNSDSRARLATGEIASAITSFQQAPVQAYDLLSKYDLWDVHPYRLYDFAVKLHDRRAVLEAAAKKTIAKNLSYEMQLQSQNAFLDMPSIRTFEQHFTDVANGSDNGINGNKTSFAVKKLFSRESILANPALLSDQDFENLVNDETWSGGQGANNTIAKRFKREVVLLRQYRDEKRIADSSRIEKLARLDSANKRRALEQQLTEAAQAGEYEFDRFTEIIQRSDLIDDDKKKLQEFNFDVSPRGQVEEELLVRIEYKRNNGQDYSEEVSRLRGPEKAKLVDELNKLKAKLSDDRIPSATNALKFFKQSARDVLTKEKAVSADKSFETAGVDAYFQYLQRRKRYMDDGMPAYDSHVKAQGEVLTLIQSGTGKFALSTEGAGKPVSFSYYTPEGGYYQDIVKTNGAEALRLVRDNPQSLDETFLVSTDTLKNIYTSIQQNTPYQKPFVFRTLEENGYHGGLQRQLNKYVKENNLEPVTVPMSAKQYLSETSQSPRVKRFMETAYTPIDYHKAPLVRTESSYRDPSLMSRRVREMYPTIQIPAVEGGIAGLTVQDFFELSFIASAEGTSLEDKVGVAASVLNRLTSGKYGDSIYDIARSPGQYEAVTKGLSQYDPELAKYFSSSEGQRAIRKALIQLDGRTDFKGQTMLQFRDGSDPMFSSDGNFFHYSGQTAGSGPYTGNVDRSFERLFN